MFRPFLFPTPKELGALAMGLLVAAISALHVSVLILLFAATLDKVWWVQDGRSVSLWYRCVALQQHELRCEQLSAQRESMGTAEPIENH
ncbi:peripheral myelin protein 22-like [Coturnix japonica]|uniref:peripheral myelin protein 22-like n=1 Tax=Coturnix japonica TaxID=93934 RepID=UPI000777D8CF|nr:peripheral myelin protein 22-like [Coturnix japonica]